MVEGIPILELSEDVIDDDIVVKTDNNEGYTIYRGESEKLMETLVLWKIPDRSSTKQ